MGLEVYYRDNIRHAIQAAEQAASAGGASGEFMRGYRAALTTVALAFGLADDARAAAGLPRLNTWRPLALAGG